MRIRTLCQLFAIQAVLGCAENAETIADTESTETITDIGSCDDRQVVLSDFLDQAGEDNGIWREAFKNNMEIHEQVSAFLNDWRRGDKYELTSVNCFEEDAAGAVIDIEFKIPRLGPARMFAEIAEGKVLIYWFSIDAWTIQVI